MGRNPARRPAAVCGATSSYPFAEGDATIRCQTLTRLVPAADATPAFGRRGLTEGRNSSEPLVPAENRKQLFTASEASDTRASWVWTPTMFPRRKEEGERGRGWP